MTLDFKNFCDQLDRRLSNLMTAFRDLHQRDGSNPAMKAYFKELFSLQTWFQQNRNDVAGEADVSDEKYYELLYKSSIILNASLDEPRLLELAMDTLLDISSFGRGFIATIEDKDQFSFITARNFSGGDIPNPEREISATVVNRAAGLKAELSVDAQDFDNSLLQQSSIMRRDQGALICTPVLIDGIVKAVIYLDQYQGRPTPAVFALVRNFSTQLAAFLKNAAAFASMQSSRDQLLASLKKEYRFDRIIGKNPAMVHLLKTVALAAPTQAPILIQGETGTGKELIARAIHENSPRAEGPFIEVDCGALPANLIESELFGHVKGAFTGAAEQRTGLMEAANGGSLFLDEINNLPLELQTRFLRALQSRKIRRVGETAERPVNFRLIAASGKNLKILSEQGLFRSDLYYRINTVAVEPPPLRERKNDIYALTLCFLEKYTALYERSPLTLNPRVIAALESHQWPGNVRELEHVIERAVILCENTTIDLSDLPFEFHGQQPFQEEAPTEASLEAYMNQTRKYYITRILRECEGNKAEAARKLKVNRSYLFQLLKQLDISI